MRMSPISILFAVLALAYPAYAADEPPRDVKGLFLLTDYPAVTVRAGSTSSVTLRLQNYGLQPERLAL